MDYEGMALKRKRENREILKSLGLITKCVENADERPPKRSRKIKRPAKENDTVSYPSRVSRRLLGRKPITYELPEEEDNTEQNENSPIRRIRPEKRENSYGAILGVEVGTVFVTRLEASRAGIHRPPVAGIHGDPERGCYSLALSGGYEDDVDSGYSFVYTGEGGRDLSGTKTNPKNLRVAPQSKHQVLERGNLALSKNIENQLPVRVLRGYKLQSEYAPEEGYRYDGLYRVVKYYETIGIAGFVVFKFLLERIEDQGPAPWENESKQDLRDSTPEKLKTSALKVDCDSEVESRACLPGDI